MGDQHGFDIDSGSGDPSSAKPYPSWDEMMARIRRDRAEACPDMSETDARPDWCDLVGDMVSGRTMAPDGDREA